MKNSLVSVIIPTYSRPDSLQRCIESVRKQTYTNIEIIVVDDNNPDSEDRISTEKIMQIFRDNSNVIYLKHDRNRNGSAARNTGWKNAKGEYITFVDDDDELSKDKIEKQVNCLETLDDSWGMCYTGYKVLKSNGEVQISSEKREGNCYVDALMRTMFMGSGSNLLLRRSVVDQINGYDETFMRNQDIEFLARALENKKIAYIDEILLIIHQDGNRKVRTFEEVDGYATHYLDTFKARINRLPDKEKERVIAVISLERFRTAVMGKKYMAGMRILKSNHVKIKYVFRYIIYIFKRKITHKSYGFNGL